MTITAPFSHFTARLSRGYIAPAGAALDLDTQIIATTTAIQILDRVAQLWQEEEPNLVTLRDRTHLLRVRTVTGSNVAVYAATPVIEAYPFGVELATIYRHGFTMRLTAKLGEAALTTKDCRPGRADRPHGLRRLEPSRYPAPNHTLITGRFADDSRTAPPMAHRTRRAHRSRRRRPRNHRHPTDLRLTEEDTTNQPRHLGCGSAGTPNAPSRNRSPPPGRGPRS